MKNTIYLVTGAAGLLGSNISLELIAQNKKVRTLVLPGDPAADNVPQEAEIVYGDVCDIDSLATFFSVPADSEIIVIHSASIVAVSPEPSQKVYDVNVTGAKNIVDMCVSHNVKKLVYISSTGAIKELPAGEVIAEPSAFYPDEVVGFYSKTKALATQYVLETVEKTGLDASIVCPSGIFGPNDYAFGPVAQFIIKYCSGAMPVGVEGSFNSVDVRDLAAGVISCTEKGRKGELYIMSNEIVSMRQMFDIISETSGAPRVETILTVDQMRKMAAQKGGGALHAADEKELEFSMYNMTRNNNFSSAKAERELDYHIRPFSETVSATVEWLASIGKIYIAKAS